ncbi:MAG: hypothetical protein PW843_15320 [Azospirillaceae bacterium]|nr:hypothetical protein [Azospirillaceae bacterium]
MGQLLDDLDWVEESDGSWVRLDGMIVALALPNDRFPWAVQRPDGTWLSTSPATRGCEPKIRHFASADAAMTAADKTR